MNLKTCALSECKKPFPPQTVWQRFCRPQCRDRYHNKKKCQILKREGRKP